MTTTTTLHKPTKNNFKNNDRLVREHECRSITGLSRQRRWELEKKGAFPQRIKLGSRTIAWRLSELETWINELAEQRAASGGKQ